jgi:hypothetical protein
MAKWFRAFFQPLVPLYCCVMSADMTVSLSAAR